MGIILSLYICKLPGTKLKTLTAMSAAKGNSTKYGLWGLLNRYAHIFHLLKKKKIEAIFNFSAISQACATSRESKT